MRAILDNKRAKILKSFSALGVPSMRFTYKEMSYLSLPADCAWRNQLLRALDVRHICDAYACVGGDTVQFMVNEPDTKIDAVQIADTPDTRERFHRLFLNVVSCAASRPTAPVTLHARPVAEFIASGGCSTVDWLYCDPPWTSPGEKWYSAPELLQRLRSDVADPLRSAGRAQPEYVCFKVSHAWSLFSPVLDLFPLHMHFASGAFSGGRYWVHVLRRAGLPPEIN